MNTFKYIVISLVIFFPCVVLPLNESESLTPNLIGIIYTGVLFLFLLKTKRGRRLSVRIIKAYDNIFNRIN